MNQHFLLSAKMNGTQTRTLVSPQRMHCTYCDMVKGTVTQHQKWLIVLATIELDLSESISQL